MDISRKQPKLIRSLMQAHVYDHPVKTIQLIETHISWVILTGDYAYKIKKPYNLGFLDFSTLEKRHYYCNEELRLNRRLAAPIYLDVMPITGTPKQPDIAGSGKIIEYAVKMVQFPKHAQLDTLLANGQLTHQHIEAFAQLIAKFHQTAQIASPHNSFGNPEHVYQPIVQTFNKIGECSIAALYQKQLAGLKHWSQSTFTELIPLFQQRKNDGFIRECHGDMHLRNLIWLNNEPLAFDCLEFDPDLRWIDTLSEVAFLMMDLQHKKQPQMAYRFLNTYLEQCGDYQGLPILRFYLFYRAMVRAMVDAIRIEQAGISASDKQDAGVGLRSYLTLAQTYTQDLKPTLIITLGLSASGKSTLTQPLMEQMGAVRIRSDVERKRLFDISDHNDIKTELNNGIYSQDANIKTYAKLKTLAEECLTAGFPVIIDAAFLKYTQRKPFLKLAQDKQIPFFILEFTASADTLRQRIKTRKQNISDADIAVLEHQLITSESLRNDELPFRITINTETTINFEELISKIMLNNHQNIPLKQ